MSNNETFTIKPEWCDTVEEATLVYRKIRDCGNGDILGTPNEPMMPFPAIESFEPRMVLFTN